MERHDDILLLVRGAADVIPQEALAKKLATGKRLVVKFGIDPTAPDLHLGHVVVLSKLKQFQDLGHEVIFLVGDFTARIGDPTGRSKTRPLLTHEQIEHNTKTYLDQVGRVLDCSKITVKFNSQWLDTLTADDFIRLCARVTVARIIEREDFKKRLQEQLPISMHELLYPLIQAYDSVVLKADVELGGTDQTFNLLCGRYLQEQFGQEAQVVLTMPLLEGLDGVNKMSKSLNNYIGLTEEPDQVFGKIMSISDVLMWRYYGLLCDMDVQQIAHMQTDIVAGKLHPKELKKQLAQSILSRWWSQEAATQARTSFESIFEKHDYSKAQQIDVPAQNSLWIVDLLKHVGAVANSSEAKRLIESGAVHLNEQAITDFKARVQIETGMSLKVGKYRIYHFK